jgi:predicted RNA-binding Zn ribbon-like protein
VVERRNPFAPWAQPSPATAVSNLEKRADTAARALEQAERDLEAARRRAPFEDDDRKKERLAKWEREGALAERERIKSILTSPIAARQPRLADTFAFQSDIPAAEAIAAMEAQAPPAAASQRTAKETADLIILAGRRARGEVACEVTAGPRVFVRMTPEGIIAAAKKARSQD